MSIHVRSVHAVEILDSRALPTLGVTLALTDGTQVQAGVPSGASTGSGEAVELRDGDQARFAGKGVLTAVGNVNGLIAGAINGREFADVRALDQVLRAWTGPRTRAGSVRTRSSECRWPPPARPRSAPECRCGST